MRFSGGKAAEDVVNTVLFRRRQCGGFHRDPNMMFHIGIEESYYRRI